MCKISIKRYLLCNVDTYAWKNMGKTWKRGKIFSINFKRILSKGLAINIHKYLSKEQPEGKRQWE